MIQVHTIEQRVLQQGSQPPVTIVREVAFQNGKGVKKIQVLRGNTVVSSESEALNLTLQRRKTSSMNTHKTMKKINAQKKATTKTRTVKQQSKAKKALTKKTKKQN